MKAISVHVCVFVCLGLKDMYSSDHVLSADGTLVHFLATPGTGDHVTTLKQDTVDHSVHADTTHVFIHGTERSHTCTQTHTTRYVRNKRYQENKSVMGWCDVA